jgi:hypothetical protein
MPALCIDARRAKISFNIVSDSWCRHPSTSRDAQLRQLDRLPGGKVMKNEFFCKASYRDEASGDEGRHSICSCCARPFSTGWTVARSQKAVGTYRPQKAGADGAGDYALESRVIRTVRTEVVARGSTLNYTHTRRHVSVHLSNVRTGSNCRFRKVIALYYCVYVSCYVR